MLREEKELFIRQKANEHIPYMNERIFWSMHALRKLRIEGFKKNDVEGLLKECTLVEDYMMEGRPLPGCLVLGYVGISVVHIVVAIDKDNDRILIITLYKPSGDRWENDWKRRKFKS
ncbi:MAG: DUF4258 domain-containing protein [Nitrospirae bacterium]|uniref:DUF4258 domain-containing protein n=1 Tax=Candidatus Magnetobacterium casense TaxID=1455061 RepID=UPI0006961A5B|nr:DUF4258 domain-containing protein [Candidatus Magnetobacterium casensis]MBF0338159.1 DUF4258 domain-containing protein [Nitrospirota bacterium]